MIWHVRDFYGPRPLMARALRWACGGVSRAIAISGAVGRDAEAILKGVPVTVVYNAIDTVRFAPGVGDGARLDGLAGLPAALEGTVRVGLVATYARWKGQDLFMMAISRVQSVRPARFYIVGGPIYKTIGSQFSVEELRELAGKLGVADRLAFVPFQAETADAFRALDVVIHASTLPEPFGRTIVEAMACSRPVVVANAGGASELFTEGKDALGVTPGDPDALAQAMDRLIDNDTERHAIGERARATALTRYARERLGRDIADVYAQLTAPPMRITFLNPIGEVGGAERVLLAAIRGAREHLPGHDWTWCCSPTVRSGPRPSGLGRPWPSSRSRPASPDSEIPGCGTMAGPAPWPGSGLGGPRWVRPRWRSGSSGGCGRHSAGPRRI